MVHLSLLVLLEIFFAPVSIMRVTSQKRSRYQQKLTQVFRQNVKSHVDKVQHKKKIKTSRPKIIRTQLFQIL